MDKTLTEPVLSLLDRMAKILESSKASEAGKLQPAADAMGHLAKILRPRTEAASVEPGAPVRNAAALATAVHKAAGAEWPPPFAADKGMTQSLAVTGFAITEGNGSCFVHMKPVVHFGANASLQAYRELAGRLAVAAEQAALHLSVLAPGESVLEAGETDEGDEGNDEPAASVVDDEGDETQCEISNRHGRCLLEQGHAEEHVFPEVIPAAPVQKAKKQ